MDVTAIVPAAGGGTRFGGELPKQFFPLRGVPILIRTLAALTRNDLIRHLIVVVPPGEESWGQTLARRFEITREVEFVAGGKERQESVYLGLMRAKATTDLVVIHDGVRPFLSAGLLEACVREAERWGAAVVAVPVKETIKEVEGSFVMGTPERDRLWIAQTPQAFHHPLILEAHRLARDQGFLGTDDTSLVERLGAKVRIVPGSYENIKITTPEDLLLADRFIDQEAMKG